MQSCQRASNRKGIKMVLRKCLAGLALAAGCLAVSLAGCGVLPGGTTGNALAGATLFNQSCATCHSGASLRGAASRVVNDLGTLAPAMTGIILSDQQVADVKAFLLTQ